MKGDGIIVLMNKQLLYSKFKELNESRSYEFLTQEELDLYESLKDGLFKIEELLKKDLQD